MNVNDFFKMVIDKLVVVCLDDDENTDVQAINVIKDIIIWKYYSGRSCSGNDAAELPKQQLTKKNFEEFQTNLEVENLFRFREIAQRQITMAICDVIDDIDDDDFYTLFSNMIRSMDDLYVNSNISNIGDGRQPPRQPRQFDRKLDFLTTKSDHKNANGKMYRAIIYRMVNGFLSIKDRHEAEGGGIGGSSNHSNNNKRKKNEYDPMFHKYFYDKNKFMKLKLIYYCVTGGGILWINNNGKLDMKSWYDSIAGHKLKYMKGDSLWLVSLRNCLQDQRQQQQQQQRRSDDYEESNTARFVLPMASSRIEYSGRYYEEGGGYHQQPPMEWFVNDEQSRDTTTATTTTTGGSTFALTDNQYHNNVDSKMVGDDNYYGNGDSEEDRHNSQGSYSNQRSITNDVDDKDDCKMSISSVCLNGNQAFVLPPIVEGDNTDSEYNETNYLDTRTNRTTSSTGDEPSIDISMINSEGSGSIQLSKIIYDGNSFVEMMDIQETKQELGKDDDDERKNDSFAVLIEAIDLVSKASNSSISSITPKSIFGRIFNRISGRDDMSSLPTISSKSNLPPYPKDNTITDDGTLYIGSDVRIIKHGEFFENVSIKKVIIPPKLEGIQYMAFYGCHYLESVRCISLEKSQLKYVGQDSFLYCRSLKELNLPRSIVSGTALGIWVDQLWPWRNG